MADKTRLRQPDDVGGPRYPLVEDDRPIRERAIAYQLERAITLGRADLVDRWTRALARERAGG